MMTFISSQRATAPKRKRLKSRQTAKRLLKITRRNPLLLKRLTLLSSRNSLKLTLKRRKKTSLQITTHSRLRKKMYLLTLRKKKLLYKKLLKKTDYVYLRGVCFTPLLFFLIYYDYFFLDKF